MFNVSNFIYLAVWLSSFGNYLHPMTERCNIYLSMGCECQILHFDVVFCSHIHCKHSRYIYSLITVFISDARPYFPSALYFGMLWLTVFGCGRKSSTSILPVFLQSSCTLLNIPWNLVKKLQTNERKYNAEYTKKSWVISFLFASLKVVWNTVFQISPTLVLVAVFITRHASKCERRLLSPFLLL